MRQNKSRLNRIFLSVVSFAFLTLGISCVKSTSDDAEVYDGFETSNLSKIWDTSRFVSGAVTMQTNIVRAGHGAAKITLHSQDKFEAGINGNKDTERDELLEAKDSKENTDYEYSFSEFFPSDFPIVTNRLVIAQWKQECPHNAKCSDDSPVIALRYSSVVLRITHQTGPHRTNLFEVAEDLRGKWTDFRFQIRFTTNQTGYVKAWVNDKQVVDYKGATAYPEDATTGYTSPGWFYFKMGLYRDLMTEPMTIYIDEFRKRVLPAGIQN